MRIPIMFQFWNWAAILLLFIHVPLAEGLSMERNQIEKGLEKVLNATPDDEFGEALDWANSLRENEIEIGVTHASLGSGKAITPEEFRDAADRIVIIEIRGRIYLWRPKKVESVSALTLE